MTTLPFVTDKVWLHADEMAELLRKCLSAIQYQPGGKNFRSKISAALARHDAMTKKLLADAYDNSRTIKGQKP